MNKCFCCDKDLNVTNGSDPTIGYPVYGGLWFRSNGNYGSTIFDPHDDSDEFIRIIICDDCIRKNPEKIEHISNMRTITTAKIRNFRPQIWFK